MIWRWENMIYVGLGTFLLSLLARLFFERQKSRKQRQLESRAERHNLIHGLIADPRYLAPFAAAVLLFALLFPHLFSTYQTNVL